MKAVIYARVSTQQNQSTVSQIEDLKRYAALNDFDVAEVFDESISGFIAFRDELENLKSYIKANNIKQILCYELSRLGRSTLQTLKEIDYFSKEGVNIFFKKENINTLSSDFTNKLLLTVLSSVSELETNTLKERFSRGRISSALNGKAINWSTLPYGYGKDEKGKIIIIEEEAKIIRLMFEMIAKGDALFSIAQYLNVQKIPTRKELSGKQKNLDGKKVNYKWSPNVISRILKSPKYKGDREYRDLTIKIPSIVSEDIWNKAQLRFEENLGYLNRTKYYYIFKSKMRCGHCGRHYVTYTNSKTKDSFYLCNGGNNRYKKCLSGYINTKNIDETLYKVLFQHRDSMIGVHKDKERGLNIETKKKEIIFYNEQIELLEDKRKRATNSYIDGNLNENDYNNKQNQYRNEIIGYKNSITSNESALKSINEISISNAMSYYYLADTYEVKREFVEKFVDKIIIYQVEWNLNIEFKGKTRLDDKKLYIEIYAFGNSTPLQLALTSRTRNIIVSNKLLYFEPIRMLRVG